jgi:hypothetical protein
MIANVRPWSSASPEDQDYSGYLMDHATLLDILPVSDAAYSLLIQIFSPIPEYRPSLNDIRRHVLAMDTFFLTESEATSCGWADRLEKRLRWKMGKSIPSTSDVDTSCSGPCTSTCTSASYNSSGSSSSAFESISLGSSPLLPVTPPAPAVEILHNFEKVPSRLELGLHIAAAQTA